MDLTKTVIPVPATDPAGPPTLYGGKAGINLLGWPPIKDFPPKDGSARFLADEGDT